MDKSLRSEIHEVFVKYKKSLHSGAYSKANIDFRDFATQEIFTMIKERIDGIKEPDWYDDWGGASGQSAWRLAVQSVLKELV